MKLLFAVALGAAILVGSAHAEPPQEIVVSDTINLNVGQTRVFEFDQRISKFVLSDDDVAHVMPQSEHIFSVRATNPGRVLATAFAEDGRVIQRLNIAVSIGGHMVKIYGRRGAKGDAARDYDGFMCSDRGCGRRDPDVAPVPFSTSISETKQTGEGNSVTTTREYR